MNLAKHVRLRTLLVLIAITVAMGLVPQFAHSNAVSAQTSTGTVTPGTPNLTATVITTTPLGTTAITTTPVGTGTTTPPLAAAPVRAFFSGGGYRVGRAYND